ncbi:actin-binding LIM protein 2-like isoform 9-T9 [Salvelinus alpinus]
MFGEGEEMYLQGNSIWHPPCRQAARQEEKNKKQVRIQLNDVPEQQVSRTSSESITSVPASSASGSPNRVIYAKLGDEMLDYKDLAALPKIKAIYNIDRPDMLSYSPYVSYPSDERHYGEGDGEKSPRQRRPSSPSSNSSLGKYGGYTPSRSPQNYSRPEDLYMAVKAMGDRYGQALDSSSLPHPSAYTGGPKYLSSLARDSSSLPMDYSRGLPPKFPGGLQVPGALTQPGKMSPGGRVSPGGRSSALPLNPTTLAMLQQHNYVPYFRASRTSWQEGDDIKTRTSWMILKSEIDGEPLPEYLLDPRKSTCSLPTDTSRTNFPYNKCASLPGYGRNGIYKEVADHVEVDPDQQDSHSWGGMRGVPLCGAVCDPQGEGEATQRCGPYQTGETPLPRGLPPCVWDDPESV